METIKINKYTSQEVELPIPFYSRSIGTFFMIGANGAALLVKPKNEYNYQASVEQCTPQTVVTCGTTPITKEQFDEVFNQAIATIQEPWKSSH